LNPLRYCLSCILVYSLLLTASPAEAEPPIPIPEYSLEQAVEFTRVYCLDCHSSDSAEAGLELSSFDSTDDVVESIDRWNKIAERVADAQMPPQGSDSPEPDERRSFVSWIEASIKEAICGDGIRPSGPMLRRLNRTEYANTMRDLLGIHVDAGHDLPSDGAGGEGFDNAAETLFVSPIYAEKYLDAARSALGHALRDPGTRRRILVALPDAKQSAEQAAEKILTTFLPRAFRRPVGDDEVAQYLQLFREAGGSEAEFVPAIQFTLQAALVSPNFIFLAESPATSDQPERISQYELASRLSYFLWSSMPDAELRRLAETGKLHEEDILAEQVARMLHSPIDDRGLRRGAKVRDFAASFIEQWLGTRAIGREFQPNESIVGRFDSELEGGMKYEPIFFFEDLLSENRSLLNLIDADFTYVNRRLADHYQIQGSFREQPKRTELPADSHRGGLLGMSSVLAVSSFPHRTSPVLRGQWILGTLLGTPPPPPPPDVPELEENNDETEPASLRERLEAHRDDPNCASCHAMMDPLGFGLENYDVLGRWRTEVDGIPIDAAGVTPDGMRFSGPDELKQLLLKRKDRFARHLTRKMLGYALARGLTNEDQCVVDQIVGKLRQAGYQSQTLVLEIVKSVPFRYKQNQP